MVEKLNGACRDSLFVATRELMMVIGTGIDEGCGGRETHGTHDTQRRRLSSVATVGLGPRVFLPPVKKEGSAGGIVSDQLRTFLASNC